MHITSAMRLSWRELLRSREVNSSTSTEVGRALASRQGALIAKSPEFDDVFSTAGLGVCSVGMHLPFDLEDKNSFDRRRSIAIRTREAGALVVVELQHVPWIAELTRREAQVAMAARNSMSAKAIARRFDLSPATVSNHLGSVYKKLSITSRLELTQL